MAQDESGVSIQHLTDGGMALIAKFDASTCMQISQNLDMIDRVAHLVAERYVKENYSALTAGLDQTAIVNLAIAHAGKHIAEQIAARPVVLHDTKTETEVYERGFFGRTRRVR